MNQPQYPMTRDRRCPFDPPPPLRGLREGEQLAQVTLWNATHAWLVTRYDDVRAALAHPDLSSDISKDGFPDHGAGMMAQRRRHRNILRMDDPEHRRQRSMLTRYFSVRRLEKQRVRIQDVIDGVVDQFVTRPQPADLVEGVALAVTTQVIAHMLGVPDDARALFRTRTAALTNSELTPEQTSVASSELRDYLVDFVGMRRRSTPQDDITSDLLALERSGELTEQQVVGMIGMLLGAGHETTANMAALGLLALLEHPEQKAALLNADEDGVAAAVEELLRYLTIIHHGLRRIATADIEIGGHPIRAGDAVVIAIDAANRDPAAFIDPDALDLSRDARTHLAFGYGTHQCLGQQLARLELRLLYPTVLRRMPGLTSETALPELQFKAGQIFYGLRTLPVTW